MQHWKEIGLTSDQQTAIRAEMQKMMAQFKDLQRQESAEAQALSALVNQDRTDEKAVLAQLDKLLEVENQIKRLRTGVLIRVKNLLTREQQAELRRLRRSGGY
jgi:Spy/CpxP family protein refolding chaperone